MSGRINIFLHSLRIDEETERRRGMERRRDGEMERRRDGETERGETERRRDGETERQTETPSFVGNTVDKVEL